LKQAHVHLTPSLPSCTGLVAYFPTVRSYLVRRSVRHTFGPSRTRQKTDFQRCSDCAFKTAEKIEETPFRRFFIFCNLEIWILELHIFAIPGCSSESEASVETMQLERASTKPHGRMLSSKRGKRPLLTKAVHPCCVIMGILNKINWHLLLLWIPVFFAGFFSYFFKGPTCAEGYIRLPGDPHFETFRLITNYTFLFIPFAIYLCIFKSFSSSNIFSQILILLTCGFYFVIFINMIDYFYSTDASVIDLFTSSEESECTDAMW